MNPDWIVPDWPAPEQVGALVTTRAGGVSVASYAGLNLGGHVGDDPASVAQNRAILRAALPAEPVWLTQVHGIAVFDADGGNVSTAADASMTRRPGRVCVRYSPPIVCRYCFATVTAAWWRPPMQAGAGWRAACWRLRSLLCRYPRIA